jgi:outer membrane protein assembly factor BamB
MRLWLDNNYTTASSPADLHFVVVALDSESGHLLWRRSLELSGETFISTSEPVLQEGLVFVTASATTTTSGVHHGFLEALDPTTGQIRWQREASTELSGMPVVSGGVVYLDSSVLATSSGQQAPAGLAEALNSSTGAVIWHRDLDE